ncbi:MAG: hypothetical protein PHW72_01275 [Candidatus Pacebacteria bacterium]|nr:hypothetical protein [Candidatus Paceibacterota bacterium]
MGLNKIVGWGLLTIGVIIIGWTLLFSYNIFTSKSNLPAFFETPPSSLTAQKTNLTSSGIEGQISQMIGEQLKGIIPMDSIFDFLNLTVWSILAFLLIFGGFHISNLGVKLLK